MGTAIKIIGWEKYNPRRDIKNPQWFAFNNRMIEDADFYDFSAEEFKAWIYLLSQASQKNSENILINDKHALNIANISLAGLNSAIRKLKYLNIIDTCKVPRTRSVHGAYTTNKQDKETNKHNNTNTTTATSAIVDVHVLFHDPIFEPFIEKVSRKVQDAWFATYPESDWVVHQMKEAIAWIHANPGKAPKTNFAKFFTSWLSRTWEWKRKNNQGGTKAKSRASLEDLEALS